METPKTGSLLLLAMGGRLLLHLQICNGRIRINALVTNNIGKAMSWEASDTAGPEPCIYTKRKQVPVVGGDHLMT